MKNVALFLVREVTHFNGDLVPELCAAVFNEYTQLLNAQCVQGTITEEQEEFVKFVSNCTSKRRSACKNVRVSVAMHLYRSADNFSQGSTRLVNYILSDKCTSLLRPQMLKYIIAMLHNNFVEFYRHTI